MFSCEAIFETYYVKKTKNKTRGGTVCMACYYLSK